MKWTRRVLAVLIALPLVAVTGLVLAGRREGAGRNAERLVIARPPTQVFRHLEDEELMKQWTGIVSVRRLTDGWPQPGGHAYMVAETGGQRSEFEVEVTAVEKDRYLTLVLKSVPSAPLGFKQVVEYRLERKDGSTRLTVTTNTRYEGPIANLFEPIITRAAQKELEAALDRLRIQVEAEPVAPTQRS